MLIKKQYTFICLIYLLSVVVVNSQNNATTSLSDPANGFVWLGTYGKLRLGENLYYDLQTHFRSTDFETTAFTGRFIQIYNRHGINYYFNNNFQATVGWVLRLNFSPNPGSEDFESLTLEPRIWHEYVVRQPFEFFSLFHRFRFEHRWNRSNNVLDTDVIFRNRWRYKIWANIPLNTPDMRPGTFFFSPDIELIMQSGGPVVGSPMEDLRIQPIFGYLASPNMKYTVSLMYTQGQRLNNPGVYTERWIFRFNIYWNLDLRKFDKKLPDTRFYD